MKGAGGSLAARSAVRLEHDPSRVIAKLFVPGQEGFDQQRSRTTPVIERVLALDEVDVERSLAELFERFDGRHRDLAATFLRHADHLNERLGPGPAPSPARRLLLGATFTSEYAIEGAALCNPSMVVHPDQSGVLAGSARFAMSVRAIGEGHQSSIGFRTGVIDAGGTVTVDDPSPYAETGELEPAMLRAGALRAALAEHLGSVDDTEFVLDGLGESFTVADLESRLSSLREQVAIRFDADRTIALVREVASRAYGVRFGADGLLSERVLWPATASESNGLEDARFVRFVDSGTSTYFATYTAYDGSHISQQLLETADFRSFTSSPMIGAAAANKGLALFPRRIRGRYVALSRADRETNTVAFADDPMVWHDSSPCQVPTRPWEILQLGNCGPPIETDAGWLVLTHGVGPMRTYSIGAVLLDLEDPTRVLGQLRDPLLTPQPDERDGYVPNVVYSCGGLVHADTLVLPYGIGDAAIGIATVPLGALLDALRS